MVSFFLGNVIKVSILAIERLLVFLTCYFLQFLCVRLQPIIPAEGLPILSLNLGRATARVDGGAG